MHHHRRAQTAPARLAILSAAFHPPTRAHLALARAALTEVDEVLFVLPRRFPHKEYEHAGFDDRLRMLLAATADDPRFSVGQTEGGLFIEIARECRGAYQPPPELWFLCGRDAAERIVEWDYGTPGAFERMLDEFGLLVADRDGRYEPPAHMKHRIRHLPTTEDVEGISSTEVRRLLTEGQPWEHLVPARIVELVRKVYTG